MPAKIYQMENGGGLIEATTTPKEACIWRGVETCKACKRDYPNIKCEAKENG